MLKKYLVTCCLFLLTVCSLHVNAQSFNYVQLPPYNGTSGSGRGPVTSFNAHRSCAIYIASEFAGLVNSGDSIGRIGFALATPITTPVSGTIKIYMCNTTDGSYLKSTTWTDILTLGGAMDTVYSGSMTIPTTTTPFSVLLSKPFKYTGGGVYVAYEWVVPSAATTAAIYQCNATVTNAQRNLQAASLASLTSLTGVSSFRAQLYIGIKAQTNDASIVEVYTLGKLPIPFGVPHTVKARVRNNGSDTLLNKAFNLRVGTTNLFVDSVVLDTLYPGTERNITFNSYTSFNLGYDTVRVFCASDNNNTNNSKQYIQIVNQNTYNYADPGKPLAGGVGFTSATGDFVAKFPYTGTAGINQVGVNFAAGGVALKVGIWDTSSTGTPGTLLWSSSTFTTSAGLNTIPISPPIPISGTFFAGVIQTGTTNANFAYQAETPIRTGTFFYTSPTGSTTWSDFAVSSSNFRFMIEPRLQLADDLGLTSINAPCLNFPKGQSATASASVYNFGANTGFGVKVRARAYNASNVMVYNDSATISFILSGTAVDVTFPHPFTPTVAGNYTLKIWPQLPGDGDHNNDTITNTITVQDMNTGTSSGTRLQFDGVDDYILIPNAANMVPATAFTIESWVRPSNLLTVGCLYSKDTSASDTSLTINMVGATPQVNMRTANGYVSLFGSSSGLLNTWTHVAVTYDGSELKLYVNGDTAGTAAITGAVTVAPGNTYLGRRAGLYNPANMGIDNFMFWNVARTTTQIRQNMHNKLPAMSSASMTDYLRFDESVNNIYLADASGNCNMGYMYNFDQTTCWFQSSVPLDTTLGSLLTFSGATPQPFPNKNLTMEFANLAGSVQMAAHYFKFPALGTQPDTVILTTPKTVHNRHWIIYKYGAGTFDSARVTLTVPSGNISATATPSQLYLSTRDNGSSGLWSIARNPADNLNIAAQTVGFWLYPTAFNKQFGIASTGTNNPLPVTYLFFNGLRIQSGVKLSWSTGSEANNAWFVVERSINGKDFEPIGKVTGSGTVSKKSDYTFVDSKAASFLNMVGGSGRLYYRLSQFDFDGNHAYSTVVVIEQKAEDVVTINTILPNPFDAKLSLTFTTTQEINMVVELINMNGDVMLTKNLNGVSGSQQVSLDEAGNLPGGVYFMRLQYNGITRVQKLIKMTN